MSKRWAISVMSYHDNIVVVEIIEADTYLEAVKMHSKFKCSTDDEAQAFKDFWEDAPDNIEELGFYFFDMDMAVGGAEIK